MNRNRLVILAVVAVVAFGGAYIAFRGDGSSSDDTQVQAAGPTETGCATNAVADPSYEVKVEEPPKVESETVMFAVTHDGKAVSDAKVCFDLEMSGMSHPPAGGQATHMSGGRYQAEARFAMRGAWAGSVTIAEPGKPAASVPVSLDVQ